MALAMPSVASAAGTVGVTGTTLTYQDAPGQSQGVNIAAYLESKSDLGIQVNTNFEAIAGTGCIVTSKPLSKAFLCRGTRIVLLMGNGKDTVKLSAPGLPAGFANVTQAARINGGTGGDDLTGGEGPDSILGGLGVNLARGMVGNDRLSMRNGVRDTLIDCGDGTDTAVVDKVDPRPIACETVLRPQ
jgi:Ca2+-binding RTX toxin-like protein